MELQTVYPFRLPKGYLDAEGDFIIERQYEDATSFAGGNAAVKSGGNWSIIDSAGNVRLELGAVGSVEVTPAYILADGKYYTVNDCTEAVFYGYTGVPCDEGFWVRGTNGVRVFRADGSQVYFSGAVELLDHAGYLYLVQLADGSRVDYLISRKLILPVNRENVLKYGILDEKYADMIPDEIVLTIPKDKQFLTKPELFMLDLLSGYQWDRPLNLLQMGGDINIGLKEYLMYDGFSFRFVPIKNSMSLSNIGFSDPDDLYHKMKEVYSWDALKREDYFADYQNVTTFCGVLSQRRLFYNVAEELHEAGKDAEAEEILDMCQECVPESQYPLDLSYLRTGNEFALVQMVDLYYRLGATEKATDLAERFAEGLLSSVSFYLEFYDFAKSDFEDGCQYVYYLADVMRSGGATEQADALEQRLEDIWTAVVG